MQRCAEGFNSGVKDISSVCVCVCVRERERERPPTHNQDAHRSICSHCPQRDGPLRQITANQCDSMCTARMIFLRELPSCRSYKDRLFIVRDGLAVTLLHSSKFGTFLFVYFLLHCPKVVLQSQTEMENKKVT
jgi:hypothetical protein